MCWDRLIEIEEATSQPQWVQPLSPESPQAPEPVHEEDLEPVESTA